MKSKSLKAALGKMDIIQEHRSMPFELEVLNPDDARYVAGGTNQGQQTCNDFKVKCKGSYS